MELCEAIGRMRAVADDVTLSGVDADALRILLSAVTRATTMVACVGCGNGVRWRHAVKGMCPDCSAATVERLEAERDAPRPGVCVAVVVEGDDGRVLLLKRGRACSWPGYWCLPGGRLERGETLAGCCARELLEEVGVGFSWLAFDCVTEDLGPPHLVGLVFRAIGVIGVPENREPDRHDAVGWFSRVALPGPLMPGCRQWAAGTGLVTAGADGGGRGRHERTE